MKAKHFNTLAIISVLAATTLIFAVIVVYMIDRRGEQLPLEPIIQTPSQQSVVTSAQSEKRDIAVQLIQNQTVALPTTISGTATAWFFEGVFGVSIEDSSHHVLATTQAHSVGNWMTASPVGFTADIPSVNYHGLAFVVFHKDNPSGNPQNDETFEVPVIIQ